MSGPVQVAPPLSDLDVRFQAYFRALSRQYGHLTAHTTKDLFTKALDLLNMSFTSKDQVHDNAAGPGTATEALLEYCSRSQLDPPTITATDYTQAMIDNVSSAVLGNNPQHRSPNIRAIVMDSHALTFPDNTFDYVICNFSIGNLRDVDLCLREMRRTLKPGGTLIITNWRVFGVGDVINAIRRGIKKDAGPVPTAGTDLMVEGNIAKLLVKAGFDEHAVATQGIAATADKVEDLNGAIDFITGPYIAPMSQNGLTNDEKARWDDTVREIIQEVREKQGGIHSEAWVVTTKK